MTRSEAVLTEQLRRAEQERDRLRLAITRALAQPREWRQILERALEETKR